jgi:hypothetical protein
MESKDYEVSEQYGVHRSDLVMWNEYNDRGATNNHIHFNRSA